MGEAEEKLKRSERRSRALLSLALGATALGAGAYGGNKLWNKYKDYKETKQQEQPTPENK